MEFGRVITAMVTPFDHNLNIDWQQLESLIDHLIEVQQSDSIVVCGTTGESPTLSEEEKLLLFERSVQFAKGRCKIIAGTGSNHTALSITLSQAAEQRGVDGLLLVTPYYNRPTQAGLYEHFKAIAESTSLPVMLYNVPSRTAVHLSAETTIRLAQLPNVIATKEASSNLDDISKIISETSDNFLVYSGDDSMTLPIMAVGGYGVVSVASHIAGAEIKQMINAFIEGNTTSAARLHGQLLPLFKGLFIYPNPVPVKHALQLRGLISGGVRLPLLTLSADEGAQIEQVINQH